MEKKEDDKRIYTVTDLNLYVKTLLTRDENLQDIWIKGEISNFTHHQGRHMYFILKDDRSQIRCAMFQQTNIDLDFTPEEGLEVLCRANASLYTQRGEFQIIVTEMLLGGIGTLYLAYEKLKKRLQEEGLFDDEHKKPIPLLPKRVGIVTSEDGAALRDILTVIKSRFNNMNILIAPTQVQGKGAAEEIANAVVLLDKQDVDVIIVGRGGGSIEDLWCFNEEIVSRAIFNANTPIISAVGHETDILISDFVADLRAPTPSAAGEMVVPLKQDLMKKIRDEQMRGTIALKKVIDDYRLRMNRIISTPIFSRPEMLLEDFTQTLDENMRNLDRNIKEIMNEYSLKLKNQRERLQALGPCGIMERGFSAVIDASGEVVSSVKDISADDILIIKMIDGDVVSMVKEVKRWKKK